MSTLQEVIKAYKEQRDEITQLDENLGERWNDIGETAFDEERELTPDEQAEQTLITETQRALMQRLRDLAQDGLDNLNGSNDVDQLNRRISEINAQLEEDLQELKDIERYSAKVAKVLDGMVKVAGVAADLVL